MKAPRQPIDFDQITTLLEAPQHWSETHGHRTAFTFLENTGRHASLTFEEFIHRTRCIAAGLEQAGATGERVLLLYPPGLDFVCSFWGCLFAGAIAVPAYPPDPNRLERTLGRVQTIVSDCDAKFALTNANIVAMAQYMFPQGGGLENIQWLASETLLETSAEGWDPPDITGDSIAFLQYTSGSTGSPKGVMIQHRNILATLRALTRDAGVERSDLGITWVPFYHDLGLIVGILIGPFCGLHSMLMSPIDFLRKPAKWLQYISEFGATITSGPNFAYELCLQRLTDAEIDTIDLSSLKIAISGGEPVQAQTLRRFTQRMAPTGFKEAAFFPGYGLAEVVLTISVSPRLSAPKIVALDPDRLANGALEKSDAPNAIEVVSNGPPHREMDVRIVDPDTLRLKDKTSVGEIWVRGPMVTAGYWEAPEATAETFHGYIADTGEGPFLRTGDSGFLLDGELYINGRFKEVIIIRGKNYFPVDIEKTITDLKWDHPSLRPGNCVVFSVSLEGQDQVVVFQEVEPRRHTPPKDDQHLDDDRRRKRFHYRDPPTETAPVDEFSADGVHQSLVSAIQQEVARAHSIKLHAVYLLWPGSIPKTSSGKLQRNESRQAFNSNFLEGTCEVFYGWRQSTAPSPNRAAHATVASQEPAAHAESRRQADDVLGWLQNYASHRVNSRQIDERGMISPHHILDLGNRGLLAMQVAKRDGGLLELCNRDFFRVTEQLSAVDPTLGFFVGLNNVLGVRPIDRFAREPMRSQLLPWLTHGRELAAFALTEPGAGAEKLETTATPDEDGWLLNGTKTWSGLSAWSGIITVFAHCRDHGGVTAFGLRSNRPGLEFGPPDPTLGLRGVVQNTVHLTNVPVAAGELLGVPGQGAAVATDAFMHARLALTAQALGVMKRCAQLMSRYATHRSAAGARALDNPLTRHKLGRLTCSIDAISNLLYRVADLLDGGHALPPEVYTAARVLAPELAWQSTDDLVQVLGERGYLETNIAARLLRDSRIFRIFEAPTETLVMDLGLGTLQDNSQLLRFLQSTTRAHPTLKLIQTSVHELETMTHDAVVAGRDRAQVQRALRYHAGKLWAWGILRCFLYQNDAPKTIAWCDENMAQAMDAARRTFPYSPWQQTRSELEQTVHSYSETIGDLEQATSGGDAQLDPFLKRTFDKPAPQPGGAVHRRAPEPTAAREPPTSTAPPALEPAAPVSFPPSPTVQRSTEEIVQWLSQWFANELGIALEEIQPDQDMMSFGVDSASVALLVTDLEAWLEVSLDPSLVWDFSSIDDLSHHLASDSSPDTTDSPSPKPDSTEAQPAAPPAERPSRASLQSRIPDLHPNWPPSLGSLNYGSHARVALASRVKAVGLNQSYRAAEGDRLIYSKAGQDVIVLDMVGGYGSTILGHNHPEIVELASECFHRHLPMHTQGSWRYAAGELCRQLSDQVGEFTGKDYVVTLANSGAEAVEAAIKHLVMEYVARSESIQRDHLSRCDAMRRQTSAPSLDPSSFATWSLPTTSLHDAQAAVSLHNQRVFVEQPTLVALEHCFHGKTLGALSLTHKAEFRVPFKWAQRKVAWVPRDSTDVLADTLQQATDTVLELVQDADGRVRVQAQPWCKCLGIFIEPVLGEAGIYPLQRSYCEDLRQLADQHHVPVVIDEIQSGMGRCGAFLASSLLGIRGDYYTFAKSLGASVAKTAAMLVDRERYQQDFGWIHTSTFAEDDFSSLVALKGLEILQRDRIAERAQQQGEKLLKRLEGLVAAFPDVLVEARGMGLMLGVEFRSLTDSPSAIIRAASGLNVLSYLVAGYLLNEEHVRIAPTTSAEMTIRVEPSAYIDDSALQEFTEALERVCTILRNANAGRLLRCLVHCPPAAEEPIRDFRDLQPPLHNSEPGDCPKIAFVGYLIDVSHLLLLDASLEEIPADQHNDLVRCLFPVLEPFLSQRLRVTSPTGAEIILYCYGLLWTSDVIEEELSAGNREGLRHRIQQAVDQAREAGCVSMGFAGYTSIITRNCKDIFAPGMGLTTGNSLTAASGVLAIERKCAERGIDLHAARVGIVGAAGNIGSIYARVIAEQVPTMVLVGRERSAHRLEALAEEILVESFEKKDADFGISKALHAAPWSKEAPAHFEEGDSLGKWLMSQQAQQGGPAPLISVTTDLKSLADCDVILCTSSSAQPLVLPEHVKQGPVVICDLAVPGDVDPSVHESCPDASVISGGILSLSHNQDFAYLGSPLAPGHIFACMGETLLMGLDGLDDHFSVGDIRKDQVQTIRDSAKRHGFEVILPIDYSGRII